MVAGKSGLADLTGKEETAALLAAGIRPAGGVGLWVGADLGDDAAEWYRREGRVA